MREASDPAETFTRPRPYLFRRAGFLSVGDIIGMQERIAAVRGDQPTPAVPRCRFIPRPSVRARIISPKVAGNIATRDTGPLLCPLQHPAGPHVRPDLLGGGRLLEILSSSFCNAHRVCIRHSAILARSATPTIRDGYYSAPHCPAIPGGERYSWRTSG